MDTSKVYVAAEKSKKKLNQLLKKIQRTQEFCPCLEKFIVPEAICNIDRELNALRLLATTPSYNELYDDIDVLFAEGYADSLYIEYKEKVRIMKLRYDAVNDAVNDVR
jgi:hypothetical protein